MKEKQRIGRSGGQKESRDQLGSLVTRAKTGDPGAFEALYRLYGKKVLNYIYRMTGSREDAEDLTQDTFVLAFRNLGALKENGKFQSWLFRIAQNNVFQRFRRRSPQMESIDEEAEGGIPAAQQLPSPERDPEAGLLTRELEGVVEQAIASLPEKYRQVLVLSAIHKLSYQEISEIVGRSLAAVKSDIHRARVEVRNRVRQYREKKNGLSQPL